MFDGFDCEVSAFCDKDLLQNRQCDLKANISQCAWDMGDCLAEINPGNKYICLKESALRGDGVCDLLNNVKECNYDNGDCDTARGKQFKSLTQSLF